MKQVILALFFLVISMTMLTHADYVLRKPEASYDTKLQALGLQNINELSSEMSQFFHSELTQIALSDDGKTLASGHDHYIQLWDTDRGIVIHTYDIGDTVASLGFKGDYFAAGSQKGLVFIWDLNTKKKTTLFTTLHTITDIQFIDDKRIAIAHRNGMIHLWNFRKNKKLSDLIDLRFSFDDHEGRHHPSLYAHSGSAYALDYREGVLVSSGREGLIKVWDIAESKLKWTFSTQASVKHIALGKKNQLIAINTQGQMQLWNLKLGQLTHTFAQDEFFLSALFTHSNHLVSMSQQGLKIWDTETKEFISTLDEFQTAKDSYTFTSMAAAQGILVNTMHNGKLTFWDLNSGTPIHTLFSTGYTTSSLAVYNHLLAQGTKQGALYIWDTLTQRPQTLLELDIPIKACQFNHEGKLAFVTEDGGLWIWDGSKEVKAFAHTRMKSNMKGFSILYFDEQHLVVSNHPSSFPLHQIEVWDLHKAKLVSSFETQDRPHFVYQKAGQHYLVTNDGSFAKGIANLNIYHLTSETLKHTYNLTQHSKHSPQIIHPLGENKLLVTYADNKLEIRELTTGKILETTETTQQTIDTLVIQHHKNKGTNSFIIPHEAPFTLKLYQAGQHRLLEQEQGTLRFLSSNEQVTTLLLAAPHGQWLSAHHDKVQIATHHQTLFTKSPLNEELVTSERLSEFAGKIVNESHHYTNYKVASLDQPSSLLPVLLLDDEKITLKQEQQTHILSLNLVNTSDKAIHHARLIPSQTIDGLVKLLPVDHLENKTSRTTLIPAKTSKTLITRISTQGKKGNYKLPIQVEVTDEKRTEMIWLDVEVK